MGNLFNVEGPVMRTLTKVADLLYLNLITLACCLPIITIGASMTALHYTALKIVRGENSYTVKNYFKSFKENFVQATIIWVMMLVVIALFVLDIFWIKYLPVQIQKAAWIVLIVMAAVVIFVTMYIFPVLAKFDNTIGRTIKNSFMISLMLFPKSVLMVIVNLVPAYVTIYQPQIFPLVPMFGFSAPAFVFALMYNKPFKKLEDMVLAANGEKDAVDPETDERIFKDELDECLIESQEEQQK